LLIWRLVVVVLCLVAANRAGVWVAHQVSVRQQETSTTPEAGGPLLLAVESLDFGEAWESDAFRWEVVFRNVCDRRVVLRGIAGTCLCTQTQTVEVSLEPAERAVVPFVVDLRQLRTYAPGDVRDVDVGIVAEVAPQGDRAVQMHWTLKGRVRRKLHCDPLLIGLGEELLSGEPSRTLRFQIHPLIPVAAVRVKRVPPEWSAELARDEKRPGDYVLSVVATKTRPGLCADEFELEAVALDGEVVARQRVRVEGRIVEPVAVLPSPLDLGIVPVGSPVRARFRVSTRNRMSLEVGEVVPEDPLARVIHVGPSGDGWQFEVERLVTEPGPGSSTGRVRYRTRPGEWGEIGFTIRWYVKGP
jgi:hypothetical protein